MKFLNLGCGYRFHPDWENVDLIATGPNVRVHDLHEKTPYPDETFDVVYHSHVLEHFSRRPALTFLRECYRVLKRGGVIRVAVPDLEKITRLYLSALERSLAGDSGASAEYDWALIEMYDQTVRVRSGGEMIRFVRNASPSQLAFVRGRLGRELDGMLIASAPNDRTMHPVRLGRRFCRKALRLLLGSEVLDTYNQIKFRRSGEIHRWMYDRFSLGRALVDAGFSLPQQVGPAESSIPRWVEYNLDTEPDGSTYKPDSIYMEATRP